MFTRRVIAAVIAVALLLTAVGSAASATRKYYWTRAKAERLVVARVKIQFCDVTPDDPRCANGGTIGLTPVIAARCTGASELRQTFTYNRFVCHIATYNDNAEGDIAVYVITPTTFHWKLLG